MNFLGRRAARTSLVAVLLTASLSALPGGAEGAGAAAPGGGTGTGAPGSGTSTAKPANDTADPALPLPNGKTTHDLVAPGNGGVAGTGLGGSTSGTGNGANPGRAGIGLGSGKSAGGPPGRGIAGEGAGGLGPTGRPTTVPADAGTGGAAGTLVDR